MEGDNQSLASELLHEIKVTSRRWFILFLLALLMLFATNSIWLYAWNLPSEETTITQDSEDEGTNNYIGNDGDIYGETNNKKD